MRTPRFISLSLAVASAIIAVAARPAAHDHQGLSAEICTTGSGDLCLEDSVCEKLCSDGKTCCKSTTNYYYYAIS